MPASFISRTRLLPYHGLVNVQAGDWVQADDVVAELDYVPGTLFRVQVADQLNIDPANLSTYMQRAIGAKVEQGELLASSALFGEAKQAFSTAGGFIGLVSNSLGTVYIREPVPLGSDQPAQIDLMEAFDVSKLRVMNTLKVAVGDMVAPGQTLAAFGSKGLALSPLYGRITSIEDGLITIVPTHARTKLHAYLSGRVEGIIPGQGVEIRAYAHIIRGVYGVGGESSGQVFMAAGADQLLAPDVVTEEWRDKIVIAGRTASAELLQAALAAGCVGLVVAHLSTDTLAAYVENHSRPGTAGEDELPMPLMLTERFGPTPMRLSVWDKFNRFQGQIASMSGRTQIRAGLLRPEVVVCQSSWPQAAAQAEAKGGEIQEGDQVRILRGAYTDRIGHVTELPAGRRRIATGAKVRVARIELAEGSVTVALANLYKLSQGGRQDG